MKNTKKGRQNTKKSVRSLGEYNDYIPSVQKITKLIKKSTNII